MALMVEDRKAGHRPSTQNSYRPVEEVAQEFMRSQTREADSYPPLFDDPKLNRLHWICEVLANTNGEGIGGHPTYEVAGACYLIAKEEMPPPEHPSHHSYRTIVDDLRKLSR